MKTERKYKGTVVNTKISYLGDVRHYTIEFRTGCVHVFTQNSLGISKNDIIEFNCSVNGGIYFANNIKRIGSKFQNVKPTRMQMIAARSAGF